MNNDFTILPTLRKWRELNPNISLEELGNTLQAYQWLAVFSIIFPDIEEHNGYIVWKSHIPKQPLAKLQEQLGVDEMGLEKFVNQVSVADLFINDPDYDAISDSILHHIAKCITQCWIYHLERLFPNYKFETIIANDPEVTISIYRQRN